MSNQSMALISLLMLNCCSIALADGQNAGFAGNGASGAGLEEIIVTAQKRKENLQDVPISAEVVGGEALSQRNFNSLADLTRTTPAVHVAYNGGAGAFLFIRGIGSGKNAGFDQSVATFVDDIYRGRGRMSLATFLDLDRIEILKGPQSTFFGNNAIAGALNILSNKPGDHFDAWARALYGQFGTYAAEGAIGGPVTDTFGVRLAVTRNGDDRGWIRNVDLGQDAPRVNNEAGRLTLDFHPTEALNATLKTEGSLQNIAGSSGLQPFQWTNCPPPPPLKVGTVNRFCPNALTAAVPIGLDNNQNSGIAGQGYRLSTFEDVLTINYRHWDHTFTSVTGYYNYHSSSNIDLADVPTLVETNQQPEKYDQFSQELRVASPTDQPIQYLVGAYYQIDHLTERDDIVAPFLNGAVKALFPTLRPYLAPPGTNFAASPDFTQREDIYSAFGALTWHVTDRLKLNAGLRASWVKKDFTGTLDYGTSTQVYGGFSPLPPAVESAPSLLLGKPGTLPESRADHDLMPSAGVQYEIAPETMGYFTFSRGFKAGGFNGLDTVDQRHTGNAFGPEHVNAYELGLKSKWFDDKVLVNVDAFRSEYADLQVATSFFNPATNTFSSGIRNAAESLSQGVELELQWAPAQGLRFGANIAYLAAHYVSYPNAATNFIQTQGGLKVQDLSGRPTDFAPKWSGSLLASYSLMLPGDLKFIAAVTPYFTSAYFNSGTDDPLEYFAGYARLDARLSLESADNHWSLDLIGQNLTDHLVPTSLNTKEELRNVALQARYHW